MLLLSKTFSCILITYIIFKNELKKIKKILLYCKKLRLKENQGHLKKKKNNNQFKTFFSCIVYSLIFFLFKMIIFSTMFIKLQLKKKKKKCQ